MALYIFFSNFLCGVRHPCFGAELEIGWINILTLESGDGGGIVLSLTSEQLVIRKNMGKAIRIANFIAFRLLCTIVHSPMKAVILKIMITPSGLKATLK